jgi:Ca-activated chloride channel family protein
MGESMKLDAKVDVDVLALQQEDEVTCLITLQAPVPQEAADRPGESLVVVVDRSGSMRGRPLGAVRAALHGLVDRVRPQDTFGVVIFDSEAQIAVPARPMADHHVPTVHGLIEGIQAGGSTNLSGGYLLGLSEARRHLGATGATVLLLSDGQANAGIVDPAQVGALAAQASDERITTGTIGIGAGYDETLLAELATQGRGSHRFAHTPDDATAVVGEEAGDLLAKSVVNAFVRITPADPAWIDRVGLLHDVRRWVETGADGVETIVVPLGDLYAGEQRELLVHVDVPALAALGPQALLTLAIEYVSLPDLQAQVVTWPVAVNVVSAEDAAGRVPDPTVTTARLLAQATQDRKQATESLLHGDGEQAAMLMEESAQRLMACVADLPEADPEAAPMIARLTEEAEYLQTQARGAREQEAFVARKSLMEDVQMSSTGRSNADRRERNRSKRRF